MIANFDLESVRQVSSAGYRAARLALFKMRVRRSIEQTDVAAEEVEEALAHFAKNLDGRQSIEAYWF